MPIRLLSPEVASQIAAGEVVERPASVVKELVENALDAGAKFISVTIEGAGQRLIEVADDGGGIPPEELPLAVERHATSKLQNANDLFEIDTLGFRGEALASIGSISRLTLTSRQAGAEAGARLVVEGGIAVPVQPVGAPVGTVIRVENLFYNVPARLKFLKADTTERRQIDALLTRYAYAYPHVRFHLKQEGRASVQTSGNGNRREALAALFGVDVARQMLEVLAQEENLSVGGFISPTSLTRSNRREMIFFVNGRPVQDATLATALLKAYHTLLMVGRYPIAVLFLELPPALVDVNVHPTKAEVRFRDPEKIFTGLQAAVRRALLAHTPVPGLGLPGAEGQLRWNPASTGSGATDLGASDTALDWEAPAPTRDKDQPWGRFDYEEIPPAEPATADPISQQPILQGWQPPLAQPPGQAAPASAPGEAPVAPQPAAGPALRTPLLRLVGQIATAFLVAEGPDGLYLVDQHAAHERVLFERFVAQRNANAGAALPSQALLQPVTVDLPPASARLVHEQIPLLEQLGFGVEPFGPSTFLVRAVPVLLASIDPAAALRVLVEDFEEDETPLQAEIEARIIARVCKRAAVKAGQSLSPEEQRALLRDLEACQSPRTCPHGRPTMIHLSVDLLERQFGRKGAR